MLWIALLWQGHTEMTPKRQKTEKTKKKGSVSAVTGIPPITHLTLMWNIHNYRHTLIPDHLNEYPIHPWHLDTDGSITGKKYWLTDTNKQPFLPISI